jgi:hypothetical protein
MDALSELGRVPPPDAEVLENARDALWSVVAAETLPPADPRTTQARQDFGVRHRHAPPPN